MADSGRPRRGCIMRCHRSARMEDFARRVPDLAVLRAAAATTLVSQVTTLS